MKVTQPNPNWHYVMKFQQVYPTLSQMGVIDTYTIITYSSRVRDIDDPRFGNGLIYWYSFYLFSFFSHSAYDNQQNDTAQVRCLCYNANTMQYQLRFANNNNNDNDDNPIIAGRSIAG